MAAKPETTFYTGVHRHLPGLDILHREKMANPYRGGTADHWYDGKQDLWVEWKFIVVPARHDTVIDLVTPRGKKQDSPLSQLQQDWLMSRHKNKRSVWVVVGSKEGGVVMRSPKEWCRKWAAAEFRAALCDRRRIAALITEHVLGSP